MTITAACPNCGTDISGPFCATCGQEHKELRKFFWNLASDAFENVFRLDSRAARTLFYLFFRPGLLSAEYFVGRRARYVPPIRLYLIISFLFFFILPLLAQVGDSSPKAVISLDDPAVESDWREEIGEGKIDVSLPWFSEEENAALEVKVRQRLIQTIVKFDENPLELYAEFMDLLSATMFFLLPVFAILLKLFYLGSGIYYAEHLLLAIHNHCFLYLALLVSALLSLAAGSPVEAVTNPLDNALNIWIPIYIFLSMKRVYQQGYFVSLLKFSMLTSLYWFLALMGFISAIIIGVMMF